MNQHARNPDTRASAETAWQTVTAGWARGKLKATVVLLLGLFASAANAIVVFDNYRGRNNVPSVIEPAYTNYLGNRHAEQLQNLINFAAGGAGNIANSGTASNINWLSPATRSATTTHRPLVRQLAFYYLLDHRQLKSQRVIALRALGTGSM